MATVYKRTRPKPIPAGAEIVTIKGKPHAEWICAKTKRKTRAPLDDTGRKVLIEDGHYTIAWTDHTGKVRTKSSRCGDKQVARDMGKSLETEAAKRRGGLIDPAHERMREQVKRPLEAHLEDFRAKIKATSKSKAHPTSTINYIKTIAAAAEPPFATIVDINADAVNLWASEQKDVGTSPSKIKAYLTAIKAFTKWLTEHNKLPRDPLASVSKPNPENDRRYERRMLLHDEWDWLAKTVPTVPERYGVTAAERLCLYATGIQTGLRSSELRSLTRGRLFLDGAKPYVTCKRGSTKNSEMARQYIKSDLAARLKALAGPKAAQAKVFAMPDHHDVPKMLREDLAAARTAWLDEAKDDAERLRREQSDFLCETNHEGEVLDFHALRHTCGAWLAMAGVHPKVVQTVMRHSTITLTMDTYGHLFPGQEADAVARLPEMVEQRASDMASSPDSRRAHSEAASVPERPQAFLAGVVAKAIEAATLDPMGPLVTVIDTSAPLLDSNTAENAGKNGVPQIDSAPDSARAKQAGRCTLHLDRALAEILTAWPSLAEPLRQAMLAIVRTPRA